MKDIKEILVTNLITLRKKNKLTQIELAEKIGYSDKAVSRWEHGEVLPDVETLDKIANVYGIRISDLLEERNDGFKHEPVSANRNHVVITALAITLVWFLAIFAYVFTVLKFGVKWWQVFILAISVSAIIGIVLSSVWARRKRMILIAVSISVLIWSLLAFIHLQFSPATLWPVYFIGLPMQIAVLLIFGFKKKKIS